jgi:hypothetical protein
MHVQREAFLKLTLAIATSTSAIAACADNIAPSAVTDGSESELKDTSKAPACAPGAITNLESATRLPASIAEGLCYRVSHFHPAGEGMVTATAEGLVTWTAEGLASRLDALTHDKCLLFAHAYKPATGERALRCVEDLDARRPRDVAGRATNGLDPGAVYACAKAPLWAICGEGIDETVNATGRCDRITSTMELPSPNRPFADPRPATEIHGECMTVLSGLEENARNGVEACVVDRGFAFTSCVEALRPD